MTPETRKSGLLQKVQLRRDGKLLGEMATRSLILGIQKGALKRTDEFSGNGVNWIALGDHHQLSRFFDSQEPPSPLNQQLGELAQMLDEINHG